MVPESGEAGKQRALKKLQKLEDDLERLRSRQRSLLQEKIYAIERVRKQYDETMDRLFGDERLLIGQINKIRDRHGIIGRASDAPAR